MDKEDLLKSIAFDYGTIFTVGVCSNLADEWKYFADGSKGKQEIIKTVGKQTLTLIASSTVGNLTEYAINSIPENPSYGQRLAAKLGGTAASIATQYGINTLLGKKIELKDVAIKGGVVLTTETLTFMIRNKDETKKLIKSLI